MPLTNEEIAERLDRLATLLEIQGANQYRVRAYRSAARNVAGTGQSLEDLVRQGKDLTQLRGIGRDLGAKIRHLVETGDFPDLEEMERQVAPGLVRLTKVSGLGPKRVKALNQRLGITSMDDLEEAAREHRLQKLPGFGEKTEQEVLRYIQETLSEEPERTQLAVAEQIALPLIRYLRSVPGARKVEAAGSFRRRKETVRDLDLVATCRKGSPIMDRFAEYEDVERVVVKGPTRSTVQLRTGMYVDLRVVTEDSFGAALHYFTGSKAHVIAVRRRGLTYGLRYNEYGVFRGEQRIAGRTEAEVYEAVGLREMEPELREDRGEIQAAERGTLPNLITRQDIRGDLHAHTTETDGRSTLEEMARAARDLGYEYLAITDHSHGLAVARGLDPDRLLRQMERIDCLNAREQGLVLLKGIEVEILEDGALDLPDDVLKNLDLVVCSIHSHFDLSRERQTERIIRAMQGPWFTIIGHPTGRIIGRRRPYEVDMERILEAAREAGAALEVSAQPDRLDLSDVNIRMAREAGVPLAISTDAHSADELGRMPYGVDQARRGWLESHQAVNTRSLAEIRALLDR